MTRIMLWAPRAHTVFTSFPLLSPVRFGAGVLLIDFDLGHPACPVYASVAPKTDCRRQQLRGRGVPDTGVDNVDHLISTSVEVDGGACPHPDSRLGLGLEAEDREPTGSGHVSGNGEDAKTRAVSADSSHATHGEQQIAILDLGAFLCVHLPSLPPPFFFRHHCLPLLAAFPFSFSTPLLSFHRFLELSR